MSRVRRGFGTKAVYGDTQNYVMNRVTTYASAVPRQVHPCPYTAEQLYASIFTPKEKDALRVLHMSMPSVLEQRSEFQLAFSHVLSVNGRCEMYGVTVAFPYSRKSMPYAPSEPVSMDRLPEYVQKDLTEWVAERAIQMIEWAAVRDTCATVFGICGTLGQVRRVWPALLSFFPSLALDKVSAQKTQSPMPHIPDDRHVTPERFAKAEAKLAEALIIGVNDDKEYVYPRVGGFTI